MKIKLSMMALVITMGSFAQNEAEETTYFAFYSNKNLNAHLFLYGKALGCKFGKKPSDSLAYYAFKDKAAQLSKKEITELNNVMLFYRDSLLSKDLLFDSTMSGFSDVLVQAGEVKHQLKLKWQAEAYNKIKEFNPYFEKLYWRGIDSVNKAWLKNYMDQVKTYEATVVPELERIFRTKLSRQKIRVDLTSYATWAGAYSFKNEKEHIIYSSVHRANSGDQGLEVVFHEASHFLVDLTAVEIDKAVTNSGIKKEVKPDLALWHNLIFYTTGYVMEKEFAKHDKKFVPYYKIAGFEDRVPSFKTSVEAFKLHWDPYVKKEKEFESSVKDLVKYILEKI